MYQDRTKPLFTAPTTTPSQVTYQTKTLFTALFSRVLLGRYLANSQWLALALLFVGTVFVSDL
jgi:drug/metabolite transporter (DMT)-like permease